MKVLTLNLWNVNAAWEARASGIKAFLAAERPDVVAVQEVSPYLGHPQVEELASSSGYTWVYERAGEWQGREEGLAILARGGVLERLEGVKLPAAEADPQRIVLICLYDRAFVEMPGTSPVIIANCHLSYRAHHHNERVAQARAAMLAIAQVRQRLGCPVVVCGDLNEDPGGPAVEIFLTNAALPLKDAWTEAHPGDDGHTFARDNDWADPGLVPGRRIDYVLHSPDLRPTEARLVLTGRTEALVDARASDHFGVVVQFTGGSRG